MLSFLAAVLVSAAVFGALAALRWWILYRRQPGLLVQDLVPPVDIQPRFLLAGMTAAVALAFVLALDLVVTGPGRGTAVLGLYALGLFSAAARGGGLFRHGFHERGIWYGGRWFPYEGLEVEIVDQHTVVVVHKKRRLTLRTAEPLRPEVRLALTATGWTARLFG